MGIQSPEQIQKNAMRAHREGSLAEAERLCRDALELDPDQYSSLVHLAVLLRHRGAFPESIARAQRAITVRPNHSDGHTQLGLCLLATGQLQEAGEVFSHAISLSPGVSALHYNMGLVLQNLDYRSEAKAAFAEAVRLEPTSASARLALASVLLVEDDTEAALKQVESVIRHEPMRAEAHVLKAKIYVAQNKGVLSEESMRHALELDPTSSFAHALLGFRLLQKGAFQEAEEAFDSSIKLEPNQGLAYFGVTQARKITEKDLAMVHRMQEIAASVSLSVEESSYLNYGLAKSLENLGQYGEAMTHYDEAHRNAHRFRYGTGEFDEAEYRGNFESIKRLFPKEVFQGPIEGFASDLPIFIVGMMRSGTTLTEQILSCHPMVGAAGEHPFWADRAFQAADLAAQRFDRKQAVSLAREYCNELRSVSVGSRRVTDKLPGNYINLGTIRLALPNAKIIHCRRNPIDTCLSIYFTPNATAPAFAHTKAGIVCAYRQYLDLMDHWRTVLPEGSMYEVQYEEMILDPERVIRGMLEFLGLEWDAACLAHDKNAKEVRTPSLWQVRQPLYSSSINRWKRYEPWLGEFRELVESDSESQLASSAPTLS